MKITVEDRDGKVKIYEGTTGYIAVVAEYNTPCHTAILQDVDKLEVRVNLYFSICGELTDHLLTMFGGAADMTLTPNERELLKDVHKFNLQLKKVQMETLARN